VAHTQALQWCVAAVSTGAELLKKASNHGIAVQQLFCIAIANACARARLGLLPLL
jgi:hypothetical protein